MKWPFIYRADHDEIVLQLNLRIKTLEFALEDKSIRIAEKDKQIQSLMDQLVSNSPGVYGNEQRERGNMHTITGRGGWRARAQKASMATIKPPADSAKALEERVKREGGNT